MDLKRTCRDNNINYPILTSSQSQSLGGHSTNPSALMPSRTSHIAGIMGASSQSSLVNKMFDQSNYYYVIQDRDPKVAGMRIFATVMLNAWRKRRDEVKRLMEEVNNLKRGSIKAKNQLHVFNTLFRVEQKRNDELSVQLKRSLEDINNTKSSCESLTTSLISLKADRSLLEQQIQIKEQEFDGLNAILSQTKSDLFKAMALQRELQANLSSEQRKVQALEAQKKELINEICEVNNESLQREEKLANEIRDKNNALTAALTKLESFEWEMNELKKKTLVLDSCLEEESQLRKEVANLSREVETLQQCLAATLGNRLRAYWNNSIAYQRATLHLVHWIAYCTLPATPPPKITAFPFGLTLEKALNIVKR
uniref:Serine/threonine-protein kinase MRCK beta n=3 Tax=Zeugodacus cucurbitae TaxID=28588 RepID=A0A0A1XHI7_ZEUCU